MVIISAYAWLIWLPHSVQTSVNQSKALLSKTLESVIEGLVPLMLEGQLSNIYDNLDIVMTQNPDWVYLALNNTEGASLYPFEEKPLPAEDGHINILKHTVSVGDKPLGTLTLVYDFSRLAGEIQNSALTLLALIMGLLTLFFIVAGFIVYIFVLKPSTRLAKASNALARGDYDAKLPPIQKDEIGTLIQSFADMRGKINQTTQDLTESLEHARLLESTVVNANDGVIITTAELDGDGPEILYVNEAFTKISGYTAEEVIGKTPRILQGIETSREELDRLRHCLENGKPFKGELKNYTKDGTLYWLDISIMPVTDEQGNITHFTAIERDITDRKNFEKELRQEKEKAEAANYAKSQFLANMSHELRTPMNGILGLSSLLLEAKLDEDDHESLKSIHQSADGLLALLNDLLDFSKIEAGELSLEYIPMNVKECIAQIFDVMAPLASRKGINLDLTYSPSAPRRIVGDPNRIRQILYNLIGNAIKFTNTGGVRVDVSYYKPPDDKEGLRFRVEDTGIGIPEDMKDKIFDKFTQADVSTARKFGGTGLGLAITKQLIDMMGGEVGVDSVHGRGSTFWFKVPAEALEDEEGAEETIIPKVEAKPKVKKKKAPADSKESPGGPFSKFSVLIVDDHPVNILFAQKLMKKLGFGTIETAHNGRVGVEAFEGGSHDIILMDCQMPDMDGFEATEAIRALEKERGKGEHIPIIALTADAVKGAQERCLEVGMDHYMSKPIDQDGVVKALDMFLKPETQPVQQEEAVAVNGHDIDQSATPPIDMDHFSLFSDGDPDEEKELLDLFFEQAELGIKELEEHHVSGDHEAWKKSAHRMKGAAANLGAHPLSEACKEAESRFEDDAGEKEAMLGSIKASLEELQQFFDVRKV